MIEKRVIFSKANVRVQMHACQFIRFAINFSGFSAIEGQACPPKAKNSEFVFQLEALHSRFLTGSCHKRQKPQAPTPQAPIRNRQTKKVANAKILNRNINLT